VRSKERALAPFHSSSTFHPPIFFPHIPSLPMPSGIVRAGIEVVTITYHRPAVVAKVAAAAPGQHQLVGNSAQSLVTIYDYQVPPEGTRRRQRDLIDATVNSKHELLRATNNKPHACASLVDVTSCSLLQVAAYDIYDVSSELLLYSFFLSLPLFVDRTIKSSHVMFNHVNTTLTNINYTKCAVMPSDYSIPINIIRRIIMIYFR